MLGERIKTALTSKKLSVNRLSELIGMGQTTLNDQLRGRTSLTSGTIELILPYLDNISAEWLLRGEGSMEKGLFNQMVGRLSSCGDGDVFQSVNTSSNEEDLKKQITELKAEKERLLGIIEKLTGSKG